MASFLCRSHTLEKTYLKIHYPKEDQERVRLPTLGSNSSQVVQGFLKVDTEYSEDTCNRAAQEVSTYVRTSYLKRAGFQRGYVFPS